MRIIVTETKAYKFNELSEDAKEKAIQNLYDINVDYEWYEFEIDDFKEEISKYGIDFDEKKVYFSLDRDNYLYFDKAWISDKKLLLKKLKKDWDIKSWDYKKVLKHIDEIEFTIDKNLYGGSSGRNNVNIDDYSEANKLNLFISDYLIKYGDIDNWFYTEITQELKVRLNKSYDYLTSEESIIETIETNDYEFTEEGELI